MTIADHFGCYSWAGLGGKRSLFLSSQAPAGYDTGYKRRIEFLHVTLRSLGQFIYHRHIIHVMNGEAAIPIYTSLTNENSHKCNICAVLVIKTACQSVYKC